MEQLNFVVLIPILIYFAIVFFIGVFASKYAAKAARQKSGEGGFLGEYLTGGRDLNGIVLAMTLVATYLSAGSFIGGPGVAYRQGFGWVFLSMAQMPTGYFTLMTLGKRFAIVSRKIGANTINDFLRARYKNQYLVLLTSISVTLFFFATMSAQWIGAARLIQGAVGLDYPTALLVFAAIVVVYTTIGGFRGVVLTDLVQGIVMTLGTILLLFGVVKAGGGVSQTVQNMKAVDIGLITPFGVDDGHMTKAWVTSFWILVGFAVVGIPNVAVRAMSYKNTKSLNKGIIYGMVISLTLLVCMHLVGAFGTTVISDIEAGDLVVPTLATSLFPSWLAGVVISGPLAAIMSTVAGQLLISTGAIVNDIIINFFKPNLKDNEKLVSRLSIGASFGIGIVVLIISMRPPDMMVWLNLYANAGIISTFLWPIILGLYWKGANAPGAFASIITGVGSYVIFDKVWQRPLGMHTIVLPLIISLVAMVSVSKMTKKPDDDIIEAFWGVYKKV